ncbi:FadR/GntR family transcriptional regulator [Marasmitruncus massiliensis]|uniref:FadR/GntR family transcriptional regulator n=1 Tax=Marasmitruncus massiliensis TaxID=1944642 RepID=UPI000C7999E3|nr:FadR/GntR family transcriptional regulator [Marasmitruncus massiliensis]
MENRTLGEKTADELIRLIREKGYRPGQKLPTEYELSGLLNVSRNTIREALRVLVSRNIINIRQGSGTFVSLKNGVADDPLGFSLVEDQKKLVLDLLQVRCILEPQIAALAAENAQADDLETLRTICEELERLIQESKDFSQKDQEFHVQIAKCSHNIVMSNLIPTISAGVTAFSLAVSQQEYVQTVKSHRDILQAIRARRPVEAQQAMLLHLLYNQSRFLEELNNL